MKPKICAHCACYYVRTNQPVEVSIDSERMFEHLGECRRYPPVYTEQGLRFPLIRSGLNCHEWRENDEATNSPQVH